MANTAAPIRVRIPDKSSHVAISGKNRLFKVVLIFLLLWVGCGNSADQSPKKPSLADDTMASTRHVTLHGFVQKGPLVKGGSIEIYELNASLRQSGKTFQTEIKNDLGEYDLPVNLGSRYAELYAEGYYYDEISGNASSAWLTLDALVDTYDTTTININLLTTLAKSRILTLVSQGLTFTEADSRARNEVLSIFGLRSQTNALFSNMNIFGDGEDDILLTVISSITMQMAHMTSEDTTSATLSEVLNGLVADIQGNGRLDDEAMKERIYRALLEVRPVKIKWHLETRFPQMTVRSFEDAVNKMILDFAYPKDAKYMISTNCTADCVEKGSPLFLGLSGVHELMIMVDDEGNIKGTYGNNEGCVTGTVRPDGEFNAYIAQKGAPNTHLAGLAGTINAAGVIDGAFQTWLPEYRHTHGTVSGYKITNR